MCVASASSSSESESAPCHRGADTQWRARLDELVEARRQLDEELAILHQELGMDASPVTDDLHRTFPCRRDPARGTTTDVSVVRLPTSRTAVHQRHRTWAGARQQPTCQRGREHQWQHRR
jgi:hypothetical protein